MNEHDAWNSLTPEERRKLIDQNQLMKVDQDIFYETLEIAERIWCSHAILLIRGGARPETAISICADACALEHRNMRARWSFEALNGIELNGTHRNISIEEAAVEAINNLTKASEPSATPALGKVWENRFEKRVRDQLQKT